MRTIVVGILAFYALFFIVVKIIDFVFCGGWKRKREREALLRFNPAPNWKGAFCSDAELEAAGCFKNRSNIIIGATQSGRTIYYNPKPGMYKPCLQLGGMGSFKTSAMQIPFALLWKFSLILFEATCETALATAHRRRDVGPVYIINPTGAYRKRFEGLQEVRIHPGGLYWLNPKDLDHFGIRCMQQARYAIPDTKARDRYWDMGGQDVYDVVLRVELDLHPGQGSIGTIAQIFRGNLKAYLEDARRRVRNPQLRSEIDRILNASGVKSIHELIQNVCTHLAPYREPQIARSFGHDDIRFGDARKRVMTIIWVNPLETMGAMDSPRRYALNCCLSELQSEQFAGDVPVAVEIDELGTYTDETLRTCWSTLRKFNVFPVAAVNDYGTLEKNFGKEGANGFINNAGCVQWMSTKDQAGCEMLSKQLGEIEVVTEGLSVSNGLDGGRTTVNRTNGKQRRRLMEPWEIAQNLDPMDQIVYPMDGVSRPIFCQKTPYFQNPKLRKLARRTPFAPK